MASGEGGEKKISFGFSKSLKKPILNKSTVKAVKETKHDFIEYLDDKAIKVVGGVEKKNEPLVIPMLGSKTWHERILNKVNADIFEPKTEPNTNGDLNNVKVKQEVIEDASGVAVVEKNDAPEPMEVVTVKEENPEEPAKTLEEQAAQEILRDLQLQGEKAEETNISVVPLPEDESLVGKKESTLDDYEQVPIEKYGEAMLRGMGWQPGKGIGKNEKIVAAVIPELRPRGMGLGADKLKIKQQIAASKLAEDQNLKVVKGAFVKIITGKQMGNYGQIAGLDDEGGRLMIKLAIGGEIISVNESIVQPVSKDEYNKNAKVLNSKKYNAYKDNAEKKKSAATGEILIGDSSEDDKANRERDGKSRDRKKSKKHKRYSSEDDSDSERRSRKKRNSSDSNEDHKRKKSKKNKQYSSEDDSDSERRSRKRRNSSDSEEDRKRKKSKKTKKSKRRDSSSERTSHKNKRKHKKERERESRDSPKRDKYKHKRSRSRSPRKR